MRPEELLRVQSAEWGIRLSGSQVERLLSYTHLLSEYDRVRIVGTRNFEELLLEHVLDSLSCFLFASLARSDTVVDVGSGGGLPGIPIKIAHEHAHVTLVESVEKKARFLEYAVKNLDLSGVKIIRERAEQYGREGRARSTYEVAVTRAVASLPVVAEYCVPLVAVGGMAVAMKARLEAEEIEAGRRAVGLLGGRIADVIRVSTIPGLPDKERHLIVIEKEDETAEQYPRSAGKPAKRPLGTRQ